MASIEASAFDPLSGRADGHPAAPPTHSGCRSLSSDGIPTVGRLALL